MTVGPKDYIDKLLADKYAEKTMNNFDVPLSVTPEKMLEVMNDYAGMHKTMIELQFKLKSICAGANSKCAHYRSSLIS